MNLAMITARGGSKRIPRKNIRSFCGKPIIAYSIQVALESMVFDEVMVSTDDLEIADVAQKYGAKVPFLRSSEASSDKATTTAVVSEVLESYSKRQINFDYVCCIYPTAPFITTTILNDAFHKLSNNPKLHSVFPVTRFSYPIQRALGIKSDVLFFREPAHEFTMSQDLEPFFHDVGQFYWLRVSKFQNNPRLVGEHSMGIELPSWQMQDIDHESDWLNAEIKYRYITEQKLAPVD